MLRFLPALAIFFSASCAPANKPLTMERIMALHTEARGGAAAIEAINAVEIDAEIIEPDFTVTGKYVASRDGRMRVDIFADGERVFTEALDGNGGWQMFGDGKVADLSAEGEAALRQGVINNLFGLHEIGSLGYRLTLKGPTILDGHAFVEVTQAAPDGSSKQLYFDPGNWMLDYEGKTTALHPDLDASKERQLSRNSAFKQYGGVVFSDRTETKNLDTGDVIQSSSVKSRTINPALDADHFKRPTGTR